METQINRMKCPYCREDISTQANKCRHCGEWLRGKSDLQHLTSGGTYSRIDNASVHYAGFWIRFISHVIDALITGVALYLLPILGLFVYFAYFIFLTYKYQATLGKMMVGIKVVSSANYEKASIGSIIMRETLGKIVSGLILFIGYFMVGFTQRKQALHDLMAETAVVYKN